MRRILNLGQLWKISICLFSKTRRIRVKFMDFSHLPQESILIFIFAAVFLVVGLFRIVEFSGIGLSVKQRKILIPLHCLGTLAFASALILAGTHPEDDFRILMFALFVGALILIAPGQFLIGMARRRAMEEQMIADGITPIRRKPLLMKLFKKK